MGDPKRVFTRSGGAWRPRSGLVFPFMFYTESTLVFYFVSKNKDGLAICKILQQISLYGSMKTMITLFYENTILIFQWIKVQIK